jgi:predicted ester cyclase
MKSQHVSQLKKANGALLERGEVDSVGDFFSPAYVVHITGKDVAGGHALIRQVAATYQRAFADISSSIEVLAEEGDRVSWQRTIHATHREAFKGFPGTGGKIVWREMATSRFEGGLIVEEWFITDLAEQLLLARKALKK